MGAWKEALDHAFALFLLFFFPDIHADIDWSEGPESLEQELRSMFPEGETGRRFVDKLMKVMKTTGDVAYIHVEMQNQVEEGFERRVHVYNYKAEDRYNHPVVTLVVLGDDSPTWRPRSYMFELWGSRRSLEWTLAKLIDYRGREEELEGHANPFGLMVVAHLQALATRADPEGRATGKTRLLKGLHDRGLDADDMRFWLRILDWLLPLPAELARQVRDEIARFEEERKVPYITSFEQIGMEKGMEKGHRKGLLEGAATALDLKFGADGLALLPELEAQADLAVIQKVLAAIKGAQSVDELRRLLPTNGSAAPAAP
jgi:hypothetical protein